MATLRLHAPNGSLLTGLLHTKYHVVTKGMEWGEGEVLSKSYPFTSLITTIGNKRLIIACTVPAFKCKMLNTVKDTTYTFTDLTQLEPNTTLNYQRQAWA